MYTSYPLPRCKPEEQGMTSSSINSFLHAIKEQKLELHSFMVLRHGHVVAEGWWKPYKKDSVHLLNSLSKSFTSTAIGFAVEEGLLTVDDQVIKFFPELSSETYLENMAALKVRHLLSMSTGHDMDTIHQMRQSDNWAKVFFEIPLKHEPGTKFLYNSGASYILSAIVQKVSGQTLLDYLQSRLFKPLGIENYTWESCPKGITAGGFGLSIRTEDIAKFGQLYLQKGKWNGQNILPAEWIEQATQMHVVNGDDECSDWAQGYGFQFWRCRYGAYRGDGAFGQFCVILPEQNAVVVTTAGEMDMQAVLDLVWQFLLPGMNTEASLVVEERCSQLEELEIESSLGKHVSPKGESISSKLYLVEENLLGIRAISFEFSSDECTFTLRDDQKVQTVTCGIGKWCEGELFISGKLVKISANGSWINSSRFIMTLCMVELPFSDTLTCHFVGESVQVSTSRNVWVTPFSNAALLPTLTGSATDDRDMWLGRSGRRN
ncbi:serine hydrolase domain-containing protein [Paenibacillus andongensis]|uniref:serine hydrolase domain-containing protein n=1 Tax=Paenibacillus andongensis TaxID=2975482 RepID=UPI0021BB3A56|nr:serine hydrolase [Paenibacillus andongensis]